jgi:hypothetical protein
MEAFIYQHGVLVEEPHNIIDCYMLIARAPFFLTG